MDHKQHLRVLPFSILYLPEEAERRAGAAEAWELAAAEKGLHIHTAHHILMITPLAPKSDIPTMDYMNSP